MLDPLAQHQGREKEDSGLSTRGRRRKTASPGDARWEMFVLRTGSVLGRDVINLKCCAGPVRDAKKKKSRLASLGKLFVHMYIRMLVQNLQHCASP